MIKIAADNLPVRRRAAEGGCGPRDTHRHSEKAEYRTAG